MMAGGGTLTGRSAVVTGGGTGVGRGIALALAAEGAAVMLAGRTRSSLDTTAREIEIRGGTSRVCVCDVSVEEQIEACVSSTVEAFGTLDILVNNAALVPHGTLLEIPDELVQAAWVTGPVAAMRLMRRCHPYLAGGGVVINVSSGVSKASSAPNRAAYAMIKAALDALTRAAAMEWAVDGIRVNGIMPFAMTDAVAAYMAGEPERAAATVAQVPLGRIGDPETDIGRAVVFLAGPDAGYLTGATLPLDGGLAYLR